MRLAGKSILQSDDLRPILAALAFVGFANLIITNLRESRPIEALAFAAVTVLVAVTFLYLRRPTKRFELGKAENFKRSFSPPTTEESFWRPTEDLERLRAELMRKSGSRRVLYVTGPSGAGKSVLLRSYLIPELEKHQKFLVIKFDSTPQLPNAFENEIRNTLDHATADAILKGGRETQTLAKTPHLIFFDQFERFPTASEEMTKDKIKRMELLTAYVKNALKVPAIRILIISRKEAHLDHTEFLKTDIDTEYEEVILRGIGPGAPKDRLKDRFVTLLGVHSDESAFDQEAYFDRLFPRQVILPVEAQVVGWTLESSIIPRLSRTDSFPSGLPDGRNEIVEEFFDLTIEEALVRCAQSGLGEVSEWAPARVLLALSHQRPMGRPIDIREIAKITHVPVRHVEFFVAFFCEPDKELVKNVGNGGLEIAHDFLATEFLRYSASKLSATDRDNIAYFSSVAREDGEALCPRTWVKEKEGGSWNETLFWVACMLVLIRTLSPLYERYLGLQLSVPRNRTLLQDIVGQNALGNALVVDYVDLFVLPIAIVSLCGISYVHKLYDKWFSLLKDRPVERAFSVSVVLVSYACGVAAVFAPRLWLSITAIPGLLFGLKLLRLKKMDGLAAVAKDYINTLFIAIMGTSVVIFGIGIFLLQPYLARTILAGNESDVAYLINLVFCGVMVLYFRYGEQQHVSADKATEVLGLMDRGRAPEPARRRVALAPA
jgi:hypothetical protein